MKPFCSSKRDIPANKIDIKRKSKDEKENKFSKSIIASIDYENKIKILRISLVKNDPNPIFKEFPEENLVTEEKLHERKILESFVSSKISNFGDFSTPPDHKLGLLNSSPQDQNEEMYEIIN